MSSALLFRSVLMASRIIHADHVAPGDAAPIADAAIVVDEQGVVEDVGAAAEVLPRHTGAPIERVRGVVFPGLVNAHSHVELSALRGKVPGGRGFVAWVDTLIGIRSEITPEEESAAIDRAADDLALYGTVAVGDVTNSLAAVHALARKNIGGSIFHEVLGLERSAVLGRIEGLRAEVEERVPRWPSADLAYAPAPHTVFTVHSDALRALIDGAKKRGIRTSIHLAEHGPERRAIENGDGPFPDWYFARTTQRCEWPKRPLFDYAADAGVLAPEVLVVHLTDARPAELARVAAAECPVVLCPRSNLYIEARLPPLLDVLEAGIAPALGTDSLASNTSLDVLAEAKALAERFPTVPAWRLLELATANGGRVLARKDLGRIARGTRPGIVAIEGEVKGDAAAWVLANVKAPRRFVVERKVTS